MRVPAGVRWSCAVLLGLAAGTATWLRIAPLRPFLDLLPVPTANPDVWELRITARGGDITDPVDLATAAGPLRVAGETTIPMLASGVTTTVRLELDPGRGTQPCAVRVNQHGEFAQTSDVLVGGPR